MNKSIPYLLRINKSFYLESLLLITLLGMSMCVVTEANNISKYDEMGNKQTNKILNDPPSPPYPYPPTPPLPG